MSRQERESKRTSMVRRNEGERKGESGHLNYSVGVWREDDDVREGKGNQLRGGKGCKVRKGREMIRQREMY